MQEPGPKGAQGGPRRPVLAEQPDPADRGHLLHHQSCGGDICAGWSARVFWCDSLRQTPSVCLASTVGNVAALFGGSVLETTRLFVMCEKGKWHPDQPPRKYWLSGGCPAETSQPEGR